MSNATIQIPVDLTNPGQFFACCGLLELADRLWPGAEGWFDGEGSLHIAAQGSFDALVTALSSVQFTSSLSQTELKRLGTLLSAAKARLTPADLAEKADLQRRWKTERVIVGAPFGLLLDWWRDDLGNRLDPKTWAAKQLLMDIIGDLRVAAAALTIVHPDDLWQWAASGRRFNFDSHLGAMGSALDVGFSFDALEGSKLTRVRVPCRPWVELLAFVGLQRCRSIDGRASSGLVYTAWHTALPVSVLAAATAGLLPVKSTRCRFYLVNRNDYFKCFSQANQEQGDRDE